MRRALSHAAATALALGLTLALAADAHAIFPLLEPPEQVAGPIGSELAVLDYDGDGLADIAGLEGDGVLTLRLGTPTGFAAATTLSLDSGSRGLVAGDLTGDGRDDLVALLATSAKVALIRGRADGTLQAPPAADVQAVGLAPTYAFSERAPVGLADLDGDDDLDVVATVPFHQGGATPSEPPLDAHVTILVNDGEGALTAQPTTLPVDNGLEDILLVTLAGDEDPDLVIARGDQPSATALQVFPGAAGATFGAPADAAAGAHATELDSGDFDDDGRADLVVAHADRIGRPSQSGSVVPGTAAPASLGTPITVPDLAGDHIVAGDLDRDGRDDLYVADGLPRLPYTGQTDNPIFLRSLGGFAFGAREQAFVEDLPRYERNALLADVDGDGKVDVVTSGMEGNIGPHHAYIRYGLGPLLVPSPADIDFGYVALGSLAPAQAIAFENVGPGSVSFIGRDRGGDVLDYPVASDGCTGATTLAIGASCTVSFNFKPTVLGDRFGTFALFAPDSDFVYSATLFGTGVPQPGPAPPAPVPPPPPPVARLVPSRPAVTATTRRTLLRRGLRFTQVLPGAGSVRWTLTLPGSSKTVFARGSRTLTRAGSVRVKLALRGSGRRAFTRRRATKLVLRTSYKPAGAVRRLLATTVRLRR